MMAAIRRGRALFALSARTSAVGPGQALLEVIALSMQLGVFYFLAILVDGHTVPRESRAGYFAFVVPGMALTGVLLDLVRGVQDDFRQGQLTGTLEVLFLTPASDLELVVWRAGWHLALGLTRATALLALAGLMGFTPESAQWPAFALVCLIGALAYLPFAVGAAAWVLASRRSQPVMIVIAASTTFLAGVYFPVEFLPAPLAGVARMLPMMHVVAAARLALQGGHALDLLKPCAAALAFAIPAGTVGALLFRWAVRRARRLGSLGHY